MEQKIHITTPMFRIEISGEHERDLFRPAAFWLSLPNKCPICNKPLILNYRTPKTFKYYELKCTGSPAHSVNLGVSQTDLNLYYDEKKPWKVFEAGRVEDAEPTTPDPTKQSDFGR